MSEISDQRISIDAVAAGEIPETEQVDTIASQNLTLPVGAESATAGAEDTLYSQDAGDGEFGTLVEADDPVEVITPHDGGGDILDESANDANGDKEPDAITRARQSVDVAFDQAGAADAERVEPPKNGEGDDGDNGTGGNGSSPESDDDDEENVRRAFARFGANIVALKSSIAELDDPTTHPDYVGRTGNAEQSGALIFRVADGTDESGEKKYETRIIPNGDVDLQETELSRYKALMRARQIENPELLDRLEQIEAYDANEGQIVTRGIRGDQLDTVSPENRQAVSYEELRSTLQMIEEMVYHGLIPNQDFGISTLVDLETHRLRFKDFSRIEDLDVDADQPALVTADSFMGLANRLSEVDTRDRAAKDASDRLYRTGQRALRDHFMYKESYVAYDTETLTEDEVRAVYAHTAPTRSSTTHDLHIASSMHELALQGGGRDLQARLDALGDAHEAYEMVVFQQVIDRHGELHQVLREDERGRNPLLINDHFLQARLALACWPASEARVRGEDLTQDQRVEINQNLAEVIQQMMPGDEPPQKTDVEDTMYAGFLNEAVAMTVLSRPGPGVDTSIALPTSEARRLHSGPDASILFSDNGDLELDIDWKLLGETQPDTISVGGICYGVVNKLDSKPFEDSQKRFDKVWGSTVHVAKLLRDEGTGIRVLTAEETSVLNQVQDALWGRITEKALVNLGIDNLRQRARF